MWTSRSTTSGASLAMRLDRLVDRPPPRPRSPAAARAPSRTPERNSWWSSTISTRGELTAPPPFPSSGAARDPRASAVTLHAAHDRLAHAAAVGGQRGGSKPGPRSRTNTCSARRLDSAYTSTGDPPPNLAALVIASRAAATRPRRAASRSRSPTTTTSTGTPWRSSTSAAAASSAGARRAACPGAGRSDEPGAQLALLAASERGHLLRIVGSAAPARASAARSRAGARPPQRAPGSGCARERSSVSERTSRTIQGAKITPSTTTTAITREQHVAGRAESAGGLKKNEAGRDHEGDAHAGARDRRRRGRPPGARRCCPGSLRQGGGGRRRRRRGGAAGRAAPDQRTAAGDQHERPHDRVGEPDAQRAEGEQHAQQQQAGPQRHLDGTAAGGQAPSRRPPSPARDHEPAERVERDPEPAGGGGHHERQADQRDLDAVAAGDARADPTEPAARRSRERSRLG